MSAMTRSEMLVTAKKLRAQVAADEAWALRVLSSSDDRAARESAIAAIVVLRDAERTLKAAFEGLGLRRPTYIELPDIADDMLDREALDEIEKPSKRVEIMCLELLLSVTAGEVTAAFRNGFAARVEPVKLGLHWAESLLRSQPQVTATVGDDDGDE